MDFQWIFNEKNPPNNPQTWSLQVLGCGSVQVLRKSLDFYKFWGSAPCGFFENPVIFTSFGVRLRAGSSKIPWFLTLGANPGVPWRPKADPSVEGKNIGTPLNFCWRIFSGLSRHWLVFWPQHPHKIRSAASWHIVCCDFCCERTDGDPFCAKNVFFLCRNHNSATFTMFHNQHDPSPPTWSFPTNMILSLQHITIIASVLLHLFPQEYYYDIWKNTGKV